MPESKSLRLLGVLSKKNIKTLTAGGKKRQGRESKEGLEALRIPTTQTCSNEVPDSTAVQCESSHFQGLAFNPNNISSGSKFGTVCVGGNQSELWWTYRSRSKYIDIVFAFQKFFIHFYSLVCIFGNRFKNITFLRLSFPQASKCGPHSASEAVL